MSKPKLTVTKDFTKDFNATIARFKNDDVLVGIPEEDAGRTEGGDDKGSDEINNAAILALNEFGSPANNIPPRPVMSIGLRRAADEIAEQFKQAAIQSLTKGFAPVWKFYERAGIIASTEVKKVINDQDGIDEPSEATLRARKAMGFKGEKALIVTGQMRNAITYVVRSKAAK